MGNNKYCQRKEVILPIGMVMNALPRTLALGKRWLEPPACMSRICKRRQQLQWHAHNSLTGFKGRRRTDSSLSLWAYYLSSSAFLFQRFVLYDILHCPEMQKFEERLTYWFFKGNNLTKKFSTRRKHQPWRFSAPCMISVLYEILVV